jgi:hypothetical protein
MYDRMQAGMLPLDAFEIESMSPEEFRFQLRTTFNLPVSIGELTAIIQMLNIGKNDDFRINCREFLVFFLRLGFQERSKRVKDHRLEQKNTTELNEKLRNNWITDFAEKNSVRKFSSLELKFSPFDKERALVKLKEAAKLYIMQSTGSFNLSSFEVI